MTGGGGVRTFRLYTAAQAAAIVSFFLLPVDTWAHALWQVAVGWASAAATLVVVQRRKPTGAVAWQLFAIGVFSNATGILLAALLKSPAQIVSDTSAVDVFWIALFPSLAAGMAILIRHRSAEPDWASVVDAAIITTGFGLLSWVFLIHPAATDPRLGVLGRATSMAYPIGDLVVLGMMVRILLGGGIRNQAFRLMVGALLGFLSTDIGWAVLSHLNVEPGPFAQHALESGSMFGYALFGAAALHPSASGVAETSSRRRTSLNPFLLAGLTTASLMAPALLMFEVARREVTDGAAIALCATVLFLLVVVRMAQLVRRVEERTREVAERNRAMRRVLDTVHEGLLRVAQDGTLLLERSAWIDRWFRPFEEPLPFVQYMKEFDTEFAAHFQLGYEALVEGVLPAEVSLAQLPSRLRSRGRDYHVNYLPVADGDRSDGLLVVVDDVTDQLQRADQDANQRELLAMFQALTRDRPGFLSFLDEANRILEQLSSSTADLATQRRLLHTLKGIASMASLNLIAHLCHGAEDDLDEHHATPTAAIDAIRARWVALSTEFQMLLGDQALDTIAVQTREVDELLADIGHGLPTADIAERLAVWRNEPIERPLARLGNYARALASRLGKGDAAIQLDGHGIRLDRDRWAPLWSELVHVVRNAVDHGWESPDERRAAGKPSQPKLRLGAYMRAQDLTIEMEDDGRGIDWEAIRRAAGERGLPAGSTEELTAAMLKAGVSARDEVGPVSGRGVGLAAVVSRVEQFAGKIEVTSRKGVGTVWRFSFPKSAGDGNEGPSSLMRQKASGGILPAEEAGPDRDRECVK
jgi:HPt (histidine-containing phosphotransfer) domain-containing protein/two-component sensor histidine kinase